MKATYAHELAIMAKSRREPLSIFADIETAARSGQMFIVIDRGLTEDEQRQLKYEGYSLHVHNFIQGSAESYISW